MKPVYWYLCALAIVSLIAFVLYGVDKRRAKRGAWRIPERVLLGFSFFGGGIGGLLAMCACCIVGLTVFPAFFLGEGYSPIDFTSGLYILVVVLLCFPVTDLTTLAYDKWQEGKRARDGLFESIMDRWRK